MKLAWIFLILLVAGPTDAAIIAEHIAVTQFDDIPNSTFQEIRDNYQIFYGHTSHGSQVVSGLDILAIQDPVDYALPTINEMLRDLGHNGNLLWATETRTWLAAHPETDVVMWSWCGGASDNTVEGIAAYLDGMAALEIEFPGVAFVYMTGHLDGTGVDGNLYRSNNQIRDYCVANDKPLFDFADIESWDPDGNYYPDDTDVCLWCATWCAAEDCPGCGTCAHSHCFNCYQKGKAFWWMMANIDGWEPTADVVRSFGSVKSLYR